MATLAQGIAGLGEVAVPAEVRAGAEAQLGRWWSEAPFAAYRAAIEVLIEARRWDELCDAFRQVLPFGTGGRRGAIGVGPNRINPWTVGTSVQGHAKWLAERGIERARVVVAYDVRRFADPGGLYGGVASPIRDLTSRDLAELAARVYAANGVEVHLLPRTATYLLSTPELSFAIRELRADGGINVSASHNPPDDNGIKVYDAFGGQLAPPADESLLEVVNGVEDASLVGWEEAVEAGLVRFLDPALHHAYLEVAAGAALPGPRGVRILYTPLHGTGAVGDALTLAGFECAVHQPQASPDGAFPTVPGGMANPERPETMAHALAAAGPEVDLVFGTDPDADRLGCEVRHRGAFVHLTGNDLAALVVHAALEREHQRTPLVVVTEVTSALVGRIARAQGAVVVDDLLVGFKYVADGLRQLETTGAWHGLRAAEVQFAAGAEESHGVLVTDRIRDKDPAGGAVLLAALAASVAADGHTLIDVLERLRTEHGYVATDQISLVYGGATGPQRLAELLDRLRAKPPGRIGGRDVVAAVDHRDESGRYGRFLSGSDRAARNVLLYALAPGAQDEGARVILRPSGTEPKLKVYLEIAGVAGLDPSSHGEVDRSLEALGVAVRSWLG